jgi:hypothetical protein
MLMGLDVLCDGRRVFVNCTRDMLLEDYLTLLPSQQTVVVMLESVEADDLVIAACHPLKNPVSWLPWATSCPTTVREKLADCRHHQGRRATHLRTAAAGHAEASGHISNVGRKKWRHPRSTAAIFRDASSAGPS